LKIENYYGKENSRIKEKEREGDRPWSAACSQLIQ
jgi:hypothetical protein